MNPKCFIQAHKMGFVFGGTVVTMIGAMTLSAYAGNQIAKKTQVEKSIKFREEPKLFLKTYVVPFLPAAAMGGLTVFSLSYSYKLWGRKVAAADSMALLASTTLANYKDAMQEQLTKKQVSAIEETAVKKQLEKAAPSTIVLADESSEVKAYDPLSGRYFATTVDKIRKAENKLNENIINGWYWANLNELYTLLDSPKLTTIKLGEDLGWSAENLLSIGFTAVLDENDKPCLCLQYTPLPAPYVR